MYLFGSVVGSFKVMKDFSFANASPGRQCRFIPFLPGGIVGVGFGNDECKGAISTFRYSYSTVSTSIL
jgi:hypothetical protein